MSPLIEQLKAEAQGTPFLGESVYEGFWKVALSTGQVEELSHPPAFETLIEDAQWAWHAAGLAAVREVSAA